MKRSIVSTLALSVLIAGGIIAAAQAQTIGTPVGTPGVLVGGQAGVAGGPPAAPMGTNAVRSSGNGIGPGMQGGVGAPTDGLDRDPYREAAPWVRAAMKPPYNQPGIARGATPVKGSTTQN